ncbi:zinc finger MYM-type protein 4-like [Aulostomus maculatus]
MKPVKRSCLFCLRELTRTQEVIQDSSDSEGPVKIFCSQNCLSSFNYKSAINCKTSIKAATLQCNVCSRYCISKKEIIHGDTVYKVCSDSCFLHFCKLNKLSVCENCHSCCCAPLRLNMEEGCKALCSADCLSQFKQKTKTKQPCSMCGTLHPMSDMTENTNGTDVLELFCTSSCVMASQIQAISSSGTSLNCDNCGRNTVPACHIAMSDASIRNFCTLTCAMAFKATQKEKYVEANPAGAPEQTQCNIPKPPEKLQCAKCSRVIKTTPRVVQEKGKTDFVCSLACSQELNRLNKVMGKCEHCKNEAIIRETKRVNNKDCFFCSDGCKKLFGHELEKKWGRYCRSCAYCLSISKMVVTPESKTASEEFCSEGCRSKYKILCSDAAKCDNCGTKGKLNQQLPGLGHVKHFCDRKCLLQFCNKMKKGHFVNIGAAEASPVITNVISLASLLNRQKTFATSSSQHDSAPDIQTRVLGHVSTQTIPKELKNKSMLCTPLVHNKGVSCSVQTSNTMAQTDYIAPEVTVVRVPMPLPVPVPVYVPVPMNLYSQYTPSPLGLPLPLPVPMFLPATPDTPEVPVGTWKEGSPADSFSGELSSGSELEEKQDESEDVQQEKDETEVEKCRSESQPETPPAPPPPEMTERCQRTALTPPPSQQPVEKIHNKSKGIKQRTVAKSATRETAQRKTSKPASQKRLKLKSQYGIDAWRRWTEWRKSQTHLDFVSSHGAALKEDFLCCPAAELTDGLCSFIREVKRPGGEPYTPDTVFFLCLCIQQYLFENGRMENIFSDVIYSKFSSEFTKMLKGFRPSLTARGHIRSCVEEEFLWECKQLGAYSPIVLLNTLLFYCCKFFRFTTVEQHRQLTFANLKICHRTIQNVKTAFLSFYPRISMNEAEPDVDDVPAKMQRKSKRDEEIREMMENAENPLRCPVRLYEFYLSKCSDSVRRSSSVFYLEPNRSCAPFSCLWFCSTPLEDSTLEAMLVRILSIQELEEERRGE